MAIPDVSRDEIIAALELFDSEQRNTPEWTGWEQRTNHKYAIEHENRRYPVKHIIALAAGVGANTFSGGDEANGYVERRGFEIVRLHENGAYIFQSNPTYYDLPGAVNALREINWDVNRYLDSIHPGDTVYLWEAGDNAGVVAVAHVTSQPGPLGEAPGEAPFMGKLREKRDPNQVRLAIDRVLPRRITRTELKEHPVLGVMLIMRAPNSTNFRLTAEEAEALADLVEEHGSVEITADEQRVKNAIERLLPTSANRLPLLKGFADTIQAAHESASGQWAISLTHDGLRLTVGHHYLATLHKDMLWVTFDPDVAGADVVATLQREGVELEPKTYAQLNASGVYLTAATVESLLPQIGDAQRKTMADAARGTLRDASKAAHVAAAIRLLQKLLGRTLPQPAYYGTTDMIDNKSQAIEPWQAKIKSRNPRVQKLVIDYSAWLRTTFGNVVEMQPDPDGTSLSVLIQGRIRQHCTYTPPNLLFFMSSCLTQTPRSGAPTREAECSTRVKA